MRIRTVPGYSLLARTPWIDRGLGALGFAASLFYWAGVFSGGASLPAVVLALTNTALAVCLLLRSVVPIPAASCAAFLLGVLALLDLSGAIPTGFSFLTICAPLCVASLTRRVESHLAGSVALGVGMAGSLLSPMVQHSAAPGWALGAHIAVLAATYLWARWRRQDEEHQRQQIAVSATLARAEERNRISSELHDLLGHSLTVTIAQANAQLARHGEDSETGKAFRSIRDTSKSALNDLRLLVAAMKDPQRVGLARLPELFEPIRAAGIEIRANIPDIEILSAWDEELQSSEAMVLTRCLQEGLANAIRHGDPDKGIDVTILREPGRILLTLSNATSQQNPEPQVVSRTGLDGLRHRVSALNGELETHVARSRFELAVWLPTPIGERTDCR